MPEIGSSLSPTTSAAVLRVFDLTLDGDTWTLHREDPNFHQRLIGRVQGYQILAHPDMSKDQSATWVKDFDITLTRSS